MVTDFKRRFITGRVDMPSFLLKSGLWEELAAAYLRFSSDNNNPRSLDDQLYKALNHAAKDRVFIPWAYVAADAAVTGMIEDRHGYRLAKSLLMAGKGLGTISRLYVDELGRASRKAVETLRLGKLVEKANKRMIGVSDGFDSSNEMSKLMLHIFAMLNEWFIDQLGSKVRRGLHGAARRKTATQDRGLGIKLVPATDSDGNPLYKPDNKPIRTYAINEDEIWAVDLAFDLFVVKRKSLAEIARSFNELRVAGRASWTSPSISKILRSEKYVGIVISNRNYNEKEVEIRDGVEVEVTKTRTRPRSEWIVRRHRNLQRIPWKLFKAARRRLAEIRAASPRSNRPWEAKAHLYPKTLCEGLLICDCCSHPLRLFRSCGKYQQYHCPNGWKKINGCTFTGSKSVRIIDEALLQHVRNKYLGEEALVELVDRANQFIEVERQKPKPATQPLRQSLAEAQAEAARLHNLIRRYQGDHDMSEYLRDETKARARVAELRQQLRDVEQAHAEVPPLFLDDVKARVADLRQLLQEEVSMAAPVIRKLLGLLRVTSKPIPGIKRSVWIATGEADLCVVLASATSLTGKDYPDSETWEFLKHRIWTMPAQVRVEMRQIPRYELLVPQILELKAQGKNRNQIAKAIGKLWDAVDEIIRFAETGERPRWRPSRRTGTGRQKTKEVYKEIASEVVRLKRQLRWSWPRITAHISKMLGRRVSKTTVQRAWAYGTRDEPETEDGRRYSHLGEETYARIRVLIAEGVPDAEIARRVGCGNTTVWRERKRLYPTEAVSE